MIVTKEELGEIIDLTEDMCLTKGWTDDIFPLAKRRMELIKTLESRPDPLALLEAWRKQPLFIPIAKRWDMEQGIIRKLRTNPSAVREQGIRDGWWKE